MTMSARERAFIDSYLAEAARSLSREKLYLVASGSAESPRLGLVYADFPGKPEALAALDALPENLRQFRPYVRTLEAVRADARRTERP